MSATKQPKRPRFQPDLSPAMSAQEAFVTISRGLLDDIRCHEPYVRNDRHPRHLHDFRVAVRRQRSALGHFRPTLAPAPLQPYQEGLARLGRATGRLRDLDVDLQDRPRHLALLPPDLRAGLEPRFQRLARRRHRELAHVRHVLTAPWYRRLIHNWERFLAAPPPGPQAHTPVLALVNHRLRKLHRRVLRHGADVTGQSPDASRHRLRIRCKKLRYLLEFVTTLYPAGAVSALVAHLKGLQDNLGEFNDLSVQQGDLRAALDEAGSPDETAALTVLLEILAARQDVVRSEFDHAFAAFAAPAVTDRLERLIC